MVGKPTIQQQSNLLKKSKIQFQYFHYLSFLLLTFTQIQMNNLKNAFVFKRLNPKLVITRINNLKEKQLSESGDQLVLNIRQLSASSSPFKHSKTPSLIANRNSRKKLTITSSGPHISKLPSMKIQNDLTSGATQSGESKNNQDQELNQKQVNFILDHFIEISQEKDMIHPSMKNLTRVKVLVQALMDNEPFPEQRAKHVVNYLRSFFHHNYVKPVETSVHHCQQQFMDEFVRNNNVSQLIPETRQKIKDGMGQAAETFAQKFQIIDTKKYHKCQNSIQNSVISITLFPSAKTGPNQQDRQPSQSNKQLTGKQLLKQLGDAFFDEFIVKHEEISPSKEAQQYQKIACKYSQIEQQMLAYCQFLRQHRYGLSTFSQTVNVSTVQNEINSDFKTINKYIENSNDSMTEKLNAMKQFVVSTKSRYDKMIKEVVMTIDKKTEHFRQFLSKIYKWNESFIEVKELLLTIKKLVSKQALNLITEFKQLCLNPANSPKLQESPCKIIKCILTKIITIEEFLLLIPF